ncbi:MAG: hypothetical protein ACTHVE_07185 [Senegalia sp. (in: firmicutes)]|uniref:hypothetical protein n=1 Tax=Senegalia sp. (in: firmicutes) TaxID=1924098 RepID=UPI003F9835C2
MEKNNTKKIGFMMLACCMLPILLLLALPLLGLTNSIGRGPMFLLYLIPHIGIMMFMMRGNGHDSCHSGHAKKEIENKE